MALYEWTNEQGVPYRFMPMNTRKYRGLLLRGAVVLQANGPGGNIILQDWKSGAFHAGCRIMHFHDREKLRIKENNWIRFEAVIKGELKITDAEGGEQEDIRQGHYHITESGSYELNLEKGKPVEYFQARYSPELLHDLGVKEELQATAPRIMPERMIRIIQEALHHPHQGIVRDLYLRRVVTELLYIHLTTETTILPSELTDADIAAVYQADAILSKDLSEHYSIKELSDMAGTNAFKLKKGFRLIFKMGVFARLLYRRMEQAKLLLEATSKPIKDVAFEAGYDTVAGFITSFRKRFGMTPLEWREHKSGNTDEGSAAPSINDTS